MKAFDYLNQFKEDKLKEKSENTVSAYLSDIKQFKKFLKKDLDGILTADIEDYKEYLLNNKYKAKSINRKLVSIRRFIDYVNNFPDSGIRILAEVKMIKIQRQDYLEEVITKSEFERIVKAAESEGDTRAVTMLYTAYYTGARISEMIQIKVNQINSDTIQVKGKGNKYRDLFIPEQLKKIFRDFIRTREDNNSEFLFCNINNQNQMTRQTAHILIKKYGGLAKVKLTKAHIHNLRHLYGFSLIDLGLSIEEVADLLGHTDINTTRIYTRKTKPQLMNAIKGLR